MIGIALACLLVPTGAFAGAAGASGVTTAVVPSPQATAVSADDWPMYLDNIERTSNNAGETTLTTANVGTLVPAWNFTAGGGIVTQPIVVGTSVYIGSDDGYEYALNRTTGAELWKTFLGTTFGCGTTHGVSSSAAVLGGKLYVGGGDSYWYVLNASTGAVDWKLFVGNNSAGVGGGNYNWASPLIFGGAAYVGVSSLCDMPLVPGGLLLVNLTSHAVAGRFNTTFNGSLGGSIWSSPSADPVAGSVYVTTGNGKVGDKLAESVIRLDAEDLSLESYWHVPRALAKPDGDFGTTPTLYANSSGHKEVAATNKNGMLFAWNRSSLRGGPIWRDNVSLKPTFSSAAFGDGLLMLGTGVARVNGTNATGSVVAVNPDTGAVRWVDALRNSVFGAPAYANGFVAIAAGLNLTILNATNGRTLFTYEPNASASKILQGPPSIAHGMVFFGANDHHVYALWLPGTHHSHVATRAGPSQFEGDAAPLLGRWVA